MHHISGRSDEEFAREAFTRYLLSMGCDDLSWERGADPPDYHLILPNQQFPVEVTQIMGTSRVGKHRLSERGWVATLKRLEDRVEAQMIRRGLLHGAYELNLRPVPNLREAEMEAVPRVADYLTTTAALEVAPSSLLFQHGRTKWTIRKVGNGKDLIGSLITIGGAKWQLQVQDELEGLVNTAVQVKMQKTKGIDDVILLLIDEYHYAEADDWKVVAGTVEMSGYHTVARVFGSGECQILYSRDSFLSM